MEISALDADEQDNLLTTRTEGVSVFEIVCRRVADKEAGWKKAN